MELQKQTFYKRFRQGYIHVKKKKQKEHKPKTKNNRTDLSWTNTQLRLSRDDERGSKYF